jgi:hypothetical protein
VPLRSKSCPAAIIALSARNSACPAELAVVTPP